MILGATEELLISQLVTAKKEKIRVDIATEEQQH